MKQSMNETLRKMINARCGAAPSHIRAHKLPGRRCRRINTSSLTSFFAALQNVEDIIALYAVDSFP